MPDRVDIYAPRTHNFRRSATYHLRLDKSACFNEWFGTVEGDSRVRMGDEGCAITRPTAAGDIIIRNIELWAKENPEIMLHEYVVMPDHVHVLFRVCKLLPYDLCNYILNMTGCIEKEIAANSPLPVESVFRRYVDPKVLRIPFDLKAYAAYLRHNPHRKAMRVQHPEFFGRVATLTVAEKTYEAYGNLFLFRNPDKIMVEFGDSDGAWKRRQLHNAYKRQIMEGSVMVSPFLNTDEQRVMQLAESNGGSVIRIMPYAMGSAFEPPPAEKYLCACGKRLLIALGIANDAAIADGVEDELRALAELIATHTG